MPMQRRKRYSQYCPVCRHKGIKFSSATDGRAQLTCGQCDHGWTEGRMPGEGREDWPSYKPKEQNHA